MDIENLLLSLAYCWYLTPEQILRLHGGGRSLKTIKNKLTELRAEGLVEPIGWADATGRRRGSMWQLTARGHQEIAATAAYPGVPRERSRTLFRHDVRLLDMIVCIIEAARRTGLCGIKVYREVRLNPDRKARKPILDGLIIMEVGGTFAADHPDLVPWSLGRPLDDETLWRVALEADNDSESPQVISDKAHNYQTVMADPKWWAYWSERFGPKMPCVMWAAPDEERREEIIGLWEKRWPAGKWLVTDDEHLAENRWRTHWGRETTPLARVSFPAKAAPAPAQTRVEGSSGTEGLAALLPPAGPPRAPRTLEEHAFARIGARWIEEEQREREEEAFQRREPRPIEELLELVPWMRNRRVEFDRGSGMPRQQQDELAMMWKPYNGVRFNAREQSLYATYSRETTVALTNAEEAAAKAAKEREERGSRAVRLVAALIIVLVPLILGGSYYARIWLWAPDVGNHLVAVAGGARAQCLEATRTVSLYASPGAIQQLDPAGQIEPGDQVVWISLTPLQRQPAGSYVYVSRLEQGRIAWQAWIRGSLVKPCGT